MTREKILQNLLHFLLITLGAVIYSIALEEFLVPNLVLDGGLTGISLMIHYQTGFTLGIITFILNAPFVVLGWRMLRRRFALSYLYAMILLSVCTYLLHDVPAITSDELLSVVFGGILVGIGVGLVIKGGACMDGTELAAILLSKKLPISVGQFILILNLVIFSIAALMFGIDRALLSLLTYIIASKLIDQIEQGFNEAKQTIIICNDGREIAQEIYTRLGRTMTILDAHGLISGKKDMLYCVMTRLELPQLKDIVARYDGTAFITVSEVSEIIGTHLKKTSPMLSKELTERDSLREKIDEKNEKSTKDT